MFNRDAYLKWLILLIGCVVVMVNAGVRMSFGVFFKPLQEILGVNRNNLSLVQSFFELGFGVSQLITGRIVDIAGPKRVILTGLAILTVAFLTLSKFQTIYLLFLVYGVMISFGAGSTSLVACISLVKEGFKKQGTLAVSLMTASVSLGQLFLIPVISYVVSNNGISQGYLFLSLVVGITLLLMLSLKDRNHVTSVDSKNRTPVTLINFQELCFSGSFWIFSISFMVCGFGFSFIATHLIPFATDQHLQVGQASNALALIGGVSVIGTLSVGYIATVISKQKATFLLFIIRAVAMVVLLGGISKTSMYLFAVIVGLTWTATVPLIASFSVERFGPENSGTVLGALFLLHQVGAAIGTFTGGLVADYTHGYHAMFVISAILDVGAALLILSYNRTANTKKPLGNSSIIR